MAALTASLMPDGRDRIFFTSGGSETIESCLKLARQYAVARGQAERWKVISLFPSYHGSTLGASAVTGMKQFTEPFLPMMAVMPKISAPVCYLDRDGSSLDESGLRYAELLRQDIIRQGPESVLAFIMEPVGGASTGALVAPGSWHRRVQEICAEFDVLLIADEVMTGGGRTDKFLACEHWNYRPDIIAMAKGFAAGFCYLNNVAAAAQKLRSSFSRVAILDVDVHHGNGTQDIFYRRADVLTVSIHVDPLRFYPFFWGYAGERGEDDGLGYNFNLPLPRGTGDDGYLDALRQALVGIDAFAPQALVVALGLDAYHGDPFQGLAVSTSGFEKMAAEILGLNLPTLIVQEGGYLCDALGDNLASFLGPFCSAYPSG